VYKTTTKNFVKEKEQSHLWHCGWPMSQTQCHPSATRWWQCYVGYVVNLCYFIVIVLLQGYSKDTDAKRGNFMMFGFEGNNQTNYHRRENYQIYLSLFYHNMCLFWFSCSNSMYHLFDWFPPCFCYPSILIFHSFFYYLCVIHVGSKWE